MIAPEMDVVWRWVTRIVLGGGVLVIISSAIGLAVAIIEAVFEGRRERRGHDKAGDVSASAPVSPEGPRVDPTDRLIADVAKMRGLPDDFPRL